MVTDPKQETVDLAKLFLDLQEQMIVRLGTDRKHIKHPTAKGDAAELKWIEMLCTYLPSRYCVEKAFVIDSDGCLSHQIDVVIFDRQYSPFLFNQDGTKYIPAESVYAVIEVKQDLSADYIAYAGKKAASVRNLHRTSATVIHAGGKYPARPPLQIMAGIVALGSEWNGLPESSLRSALSRLSKAERLDFGCSLKYGSFSPIYVGDTVERIDTSPKDEALISFFLSLVHHLQRLGTVPAIDVREYASSLTVH